MLINDLKEKFPLNEKEILSFINSAPNRYKLYNIKKRHGGIREIAEPTKSLKILQSWALNKYLSKYKIHPSAIAYVKNKNIKDFVLPHSNNSYLLKMDFKDFFNSIKDIDFLNFLEDKASDFSQEERQLLTNIFFCKNKTSKNKGLYLSIGAPSSPFISNIIMINFDNKVSEFCIDNGIIYTRYADDLAFSTNTPNTLNKLINKIKIICEQLNYPRKLEINSEKTVFTSRKHNRTLTGLVISNTGKVSIGREKKRKLRVIAHKASLRRLDQESLDKFKGTLSFLLSIDPDFSYYLKQKANI
ncbi:retron St85 family RNA-directed DNA polymerase [Aggregatibacter sp.]